MCPSLKETLSISVQLGESKLGSLIFWTHVNFCLFRLELREASPYWTDAILRPETSGCPEKSKIYGMKPVSFKISAF